MNTIATLEMIEDLTNRQTGDISISLYCPEDTSVGISEDWVENQELVNALIENIPPYEHTKRKNVIVNHFVKAGFRMISITQTPIFINSKGEITEVRTEAYFELPSIA